MAQVDHPKWRAWSGYAFENICLQHIEKIKAALGIAGVFTRQFSFQAKATDDEEGAQIDLLIDRNDRVINLFELKFYSKEFLLTKAYSMDLRRKMMVFEHNTKTKKQISWAMLTTFGLADNAYRLDLIDHDLTIDVLFE